MLDFGQFHGGSPVFDIDLLLPDKYLADTTEGDRLPLAWVRECYGPASFWDDFEVQQLVYRLHNDLGALFIILSQMAKLSCLQ